MTKKEIEMHKKLAQKLDKVINWAMANKYPIEILLVTFSVVLVDIMVVAHALQHKEEVNYNEGDILYDQLVDFIKKYISEGISPCASAK